MGWIIAAGVLMAAAAGLWITMQHGCLPFVRLNRKPREGQIRVACVGDSITYGYGIRNWSCNNYPAQLGHWLGDGYCVQNFGVCGATASLQGDLPHEKEAAYRESLAFRPEIVLLMLGTNDSKPNNYRGQEAYAEDMKRILAAYRALPSRPRVYLLTPPPAFSVNGNPVAFDIQADVIENELRPAVKALANTEEVPCIDLYAACENRSEWFWDGIHPNADGAKGITETITAYLKQEQQV